MAAGKTMEEIMKVMSVAELSMWSPLELARLYQYVGKCLPGTRMGSPERQTVEQTLANIRFVLARKHRTPRC
jgi:hypothetical protein